MTKHVLFVLSPDLNQNTFWDELEQIVSQEGKVWACAKSAFDFKSVILEERSTLP